jgi:hypothetical protein
LISARDPAGQWRRNRGVGRDLLFPVAIPGQSGRVRTSLPCPHYLSAPASEPPALSAALGDLGSSIVSAPTIAMLSLGVIAIRTTSPSSTL